MEASGSEARWTSGNDGSHEEQQFLAYIVGLLDTSGRRGRLASCLGGELLTRGLATSGLAGSLLGTGHY